MNIDERKITIWQSLENPPEVNDDDLKHITWEDLDNAFDFYSAISKFCELSIDSLSYITDIGIPAYKSNVINSNISESINKRKSLLKMKMDDFLTDVKESRKLFDDDFEGKINDISHELRKSEKLNSDLPKIETLENGESDISDFQNLESGSAHQRGILTTMMFWDGISKLMNDIDQIILSLQSFFADLYELDANVGHAINTNLESIRMAQLGSAHLLINGGLSTSIDGLSTSIGGTASVIAGLEVAGSAWPVIMPGNTAAAGGLGTDIAGLSTQIAGVTDQIANHVKACQAAALAGITMGLDSTLYSPLETIKDAGRISRDLKQLVYWVIKLVLDINFIRFVLSTPHVPHLPIYPWEAMNMVEDNWWIPFVQNPSEIAWPWEAAAVSLPWFTPVPPVADEFVEFVNEPFDPIEIIIPELIEAEEVEVAVEEISAEVEMISIENEVNKIEQVMDAVSRIDIESIQEESIGSEEGEVSGDPSGEGGESTESGESSNPPTNPENPSSSTDPSIPEIPTNPTDPMNPVTPVNPTDPISPSTDVFGVILPKKPTIQSSVKSYMERSKPVLKSWNTLPRKKNSHRVRKNI